MKKYGLAVILCLILVGNADATVSKERIDHADLRPVTNTLELVLGEKFLADSPYGLSPTMFEYGVQYELKKRHPHYWSMVASLMKGSTSGSSGSSCGVTSISSHHSSGDSDGSPSSSPKSSCVFTAVNSALDLATLGFGLQHHQHVYDFKIQPYVGGGVALTHANLQFNGKSESGTGLGIYGEFGLIYALDPIVFNIGYKYSYEPSLGYNFGGHELLWRVGLNF